MSNPLFLLGAGFNVDVRKEVTPKNNPSGNNLHYPILEDLHNICFHDGKLDPNIFIEEKFNKEIKMGNYKPLKDLCEILFECDQYLVKELFSDKQKRYYYYERLKMPHLFYNKALIETCYSKFFEHFKNSHFLTFNYDGLVEVFLYNMERWFPHDGYGTRINIEKEIYSNSNNNEISMRSSNLVIHLHGSLYIYTSEFSSNIVSKGQNYITEQIFHTDPKYYFNPYYNVGLFIPYKNFYPDKNVEYFIEKRVIAPLPDKTDELKKPFIIQMYSKAKELLRKTDLLITIGYDYNENDKSSYEQLLKTFSKQPDSKVLVISPNLKDIRNRLSKNYRNIKYLDIESMTFKEWVESGFIGVN